MGEGHGPGGLGDGVRAFPPGAGPAPRPVGDGGAAGHEPHGEIMLQLVFPDFVDGDDVGVVQVRGRVRLALEHPQRLGSGQLAGEDHLQGDFAVQAALPGPVNDAHAARAISPSSS